MNKKITKFLENCSLVLLYMGLMTIPIFSYTQSKVTVFLDSNDNGIQDGGETTLISDVTFEAVDINGNVVDYTETSPGVFTFNSNLRISVHLTEFSESYRQGKAGGTTVLFLENESAKIALLENSYFNYLLTDVIIPCYEAGASEGNQGPSLVKFDYDNNGVAQKNGGAAPDPTVLATLEQIGSTWGVGFDKTYNQVYTSAVVKRHVGLGPEGTDGIYHINPETNEITGYSLQGLSTNNGSLDFGTLNRSVVSGQVGNNPYALSTSFTSSYDIDAFDKVGKVGIGDIDVPDNRNELWLINLNQRTLVSIETSEDGLDLSNVKSYPFLNEIPHPMSDNPIERNFNVGGVGEMGAESFTDMNMVAWEKSKYLVSGQTSYTKNPVSNTMNSEEGTTKQSLYQTYAIGSEVALEIPVVDDTYELVLHFAELQSNFGIGDRVFDIEIEGEVLYSDFDITQEAKGNLRAITLKMEAEVGDKVLNVRLLGKNGKQAMLNGIQIKGSKGMMTGELRPWALSFHDGKGYLGLINDAMYSRSKSHLYALVYEFDPENPMGSFTKVLEFPLDYPRERVSFANNDDPRPNRTAVWEPWVSTWEEANIPLSGSGNLQVDFPQPIMSDIDFDANGNMVIGLMDRWGHQAGYANYSTIMGDQTLIYAYAAGDILKACKSGNSFILECENFDTGQFYSDEDGPNYNGEFFHMDHFVVNGVANHGEIFTGGLGIMDGQMMVMNTVFNPVALPNGTNTDIEDNGIFTQGIHVYSTEDGGKDRAYLFVDQYEYGKANGLGDIEFAPLALEGQIGNYIWVDSDKDGRQDPEEKGISGVIVTLMDQNGNMVGQTTTDENGQYYFSGVPVGCYQIKVDLNQSALDGFSNTVTDSNSTNDELDSDASGDIIPGFAVINYCVENTAENNHSLDIGIHGPIATEGEAILCENAPGSNMADFVLSTIDSQVDPSGSNDVTYYLNETDANNKVNVLPNNYTSGPKTIYARVTHPSDMAFYNIAPVTLDVIQGEIARNYQREVCGNSVVHLETLVDFEYTSLQFFFDEQRENPIPDNNYFADADELPETVYFSAESADNCFIMGYIVLEAIEYPTLNLGAVADEVCLGQTFNMGNIMSSVDYNGHNLIAYWTTNGSGKFINSSAYGSALAYEPGPNDDALSPLKFYLQIDGFQCVDKIIDSVSVSVNPNPTELICSENVTVNCNSPRANPLAQENFNRPTAFFQCRPIEVELIDVTVESFNCEDDITSQIIRTWKVKQSEKDKECYLDTIDGIVVNHCNDLSDLVCIDTVFVRAAPMDMIECPDTMVVLNCNSNYKKFGDTLGFIPHPDASGHPTIDGVNIWPEYHGCGYYAHFTDQIIDDQCGGNTFVIKRDWIVGNKCTGMKMECSQWIMINDEVAPTINVFSRAGRWGGYRARRGSNLYFTTNDHDCSRSITPEIIAGDGCSGVKSVQMMVEDGPLVTMENVSGRIYRASRPVNFTTYNTVKRVTFVVLDSCHNERRASVLLNLVDDVAPHAIVNQGLIVSLSEKKTWVNYKSIEKQSFDNCGLEGVYVRRADWAELCIDLCSDELDKIKNLDDLLKFDISKVLGDGEMAEVEKHYLDFYHWALEDGIDCELDLAEVIKFNIYKYWIENCLGKDEHGNDVVRLSELKEYYNLHGLNHYKYENLGGGWSKDVLLTCEDVCTDVKVELLAVDHACNYTKTWTTIKVEDKSELITIQKLDDIDISCLGYDLYSDMINTALEAGSSSANADAFNSMDNIFGGYEIAWINEFNEPVDMSGNLIPSVNSFNDYRCEYSQNIVPRNDTTHTGIDWVFDTIDVVNQVSTTKDFKVGLIKGLCDNVNIEQDIWSYLDDCGQGYLIRRFIITKGCGDHDSEPIILQQRINVTKENTCELNKAMFILPKDETVCTPLEYGVNGNVVLPDQVSKLIYTFKTSCRMLGMDFSDAVFAVTGQPNMYKIHRNWEVVDWCTNESFNYLQKIVLVDTCSGNLSSQLNVVVNTTDNRSIGAVDIMVYNEKGQMVEQLKNQNGRASIASISNDYTVKPVKNSNPDNGLSVLDILAMRRHITGRSPLMDQFDLIAGDVNEDGSINVLDLLEVRRLLLGKQNSFSHGKSWKFMLEKDFNKDSYVFNSSIVNNTVKFYGLKYGDLTDDFNPNRSSRRQLFILKTEVDGLHVYAGSDIDKLEGLQLNLGKQISDIQLENGTLSLDANQWHYTSNQQLRILFTLEEAINVKEGEKLFVIKGGEFSGIENADFQSVVVDARGPKGVDFKHVTPEFKVGQSIPNPANAKVYIPFELPIDGEVQLNILDVNGKLIEQRKEDFLIGNNQFSIDLDQKYTSGIHFYQVIFNNKSEMRKMTILK